MVSRSRRANDLAWAIRSEPLVLSTPDGLWPDRDWFKQLPLPELDITDFDPFTRLGLWFEQVIREWANATPGTDIVANNLQIRDETRTLGEFDLLLNHQGHLEHWELAIKFYLATGDQLDAKNWYGPNPNDTLAHKLEHLKTHQMKLSEYREASRVLAENHWEIVQVRGFVKGRLFYPIEQFERGEFIHPPEIQPQHNKGWWMTENDFRQDKHFDKTVTFCLLEKALWLSPIKQAHGIESEDHATIQLKIEASSSRTHPVAIIDVDGNEVSRGFVISPQWLEEVNRSA